MKSRNYIAVRIIVICLIASCAGIAVSGCGSQFTTVRVSHDLQDDFIPYIPNANKVSLFVERLSDERGIVKQNVIGDAKTGLFNKSTPIIIEDSITELSTSILQDAFAKAGFKLAVEEHDADLVFKGRINAFWVQEFPGTFSEHSEADVEFDVVLVSRANGETLWFDVKKSHVRSKSTGLDITSQNEKIVSQALHEVVTAILNDGDLAAAVNDFEGSTE